MKRNMFGEPRPETGDEIDEVLSDVGVHADTVTARIDTSEAWDPAGANTEGVNMTGFSAELCDEDGETVATTNGFEFLAELKLVLRGVGIPENQIEVM